MRFLLVIAALLAMKIPRQIRASSHASVLYGLREGLSYSFGFRPVRAILLLVATMGLWAMPYNVLMPVVADRILGGGPRTFGFLIGSAGVGALCGSLYLASRSTVLGLGRWIAGTGITFGISLIAFSFSTSVWLSMAFLVVLGFCLVVQLASCNTILQTIVEEAMRGRVMSLYTVAFLGMNPLGSLLAGGLASWIGVPHTLRVGGAFSMLAAVLFALSLPDIRRTIRPIYARMGILPSVAASVQSAAESAMPQED
jgi:MFS family permease